MNIAWKDRVALVALLEQKTQVSAAASLGITQAALSQRLKSLSEKVPFQLLREQGKSRQLSPQGRDLAHFWKMEIQEFHQKEERLFSRIHDPQLYTLKVCGRSEILKIFYKELLAFPSCVHCREANTQEAKALLLNGEADMVISKEKIDSIDVIARKIFDGRFCLVAPKTRAFPEGDIPWTVLKESPYLSYKNSIEEECVLEPHIDRSQLLRKFVFEDWESVVSAVQERFGWSLVPKEKIVHLQKLRIYELENKKTQYSFYLNYSKSLKHLKWFQESMKNF